MPQELTKDATVLTQAVIDQLDAGKDEGRLDLKYNYYGEQELIPDYPATVCVSYPKIRGHGTQRQFDVVMRVLILVLHEKVQSSEKTKKETEQLAEKVEDELARDRTFGGIVIYSYIERINPGRVTSANKDVMGRASALTLYAPSRELWQAQQT